MRVPSILGRCGVRQVIGSLMHQVLVQNVPVSQFNLAALKVFARFPWNTRPSSAAPRPQESNKP